MRAMLISSVLITRWQLVTRCTGHNVTEIILMAYLNHKYYFSYIVCIIII